MCKFHDRLEESLSRQTLGLSANTLGFLSGRGGRGREAERQEPRGGGGRGKERGDIEGERASGRVARASAGCTVRQVRVLFWRCMGGACVLHEAEEQDVVARLRLQGIAGGGGCKKKAKRGGKALQGEA